MLDFSLSRPSEFLPLLASPAPAFGILCPSTFGLSWIFFRKYQHRSDLFWKTVSLLTDLLSVVGIIGVAATLGRAVLDDNVRGTNEASNHAEQLLQDEVHGVLFNLCFQPIQYLNASVQKTYLGPTRERAEKDQLCENLKDLAGVGAQKRPLGINAPDLDLEKEGEKFHDAPSNGPKDPYANESLKIAGQIEAFSAAKKSVPMAELERQVISELTPTSFLIGCLLATWVALWMKLGRSFREFTKS